MKRKHMVYAVLFLASAAVLAFADKDPDDQVVEAAPHRSARDATPSTHSGAGAIVSIAALRPRAELVGSGDGEHHDLFGALASVSQLPSAAPANAQVPPLPPTPLVPSMPFTYLGKQEADGRWEVYLARGNDTLIVHENTVIDGTYRINAITPPTMTFVYLPQKLVQTMDIGSAD
jgi:hypothetical protein